jgi:CBS domain-containing protein
MTVVKDLFRREPGEVVTVDSNAILASAVRLLMNHNIGGVPVVASGGSVVGFIAERDVVKALESNSEHALRLPVQQVMRRPAPICHSDDSLQEVMARMTRDRLRHLVVVDAGRIVGVISVGDIVKYRLEQLETETGVLRDYVAARRASA